MSSKDFPIGWCIEGGKRLGEVERQGAELERSGKPIIRKRIDLQRMRESASRGGQKGWKARVAKLRAAREALAESNLPEED